MRNVIFIKLSLLLMVVAFVFVACDKEDVPKDIIVQNSSSQTQTVFADDGQGSSGVSFTTTGPWTSSISTVSPNAKSAQVKAGNDSPNWISISPDAGKAAGSYTIEISLVPNITGVDRMAIITISCGDNNITVTVTQKGIKEDGTTPEKPSVSDGRIKKINGKNVVYTEEHNGVFTAESIGSDLYISKSVAGQWVYLAWDNYYGLGQERCDYEYGNNGNLSKIKADIYLRAISTETIERVSEFHWNNNELSYVRGDQVAVAGGSYLRTDFEYGDTEYTLGNIDINWLLSTAEYYTGLPVSAIGIKTSKNNQLLVKKTQVEEDGNGKYDNAFTYRYVFDKDRYIIEIYQTQVSLDGSANGEESLIYTFEY